MKKLLCLLLALMMLLVLMAGCVSDSDRRREDDDEDAGKGGYSSGDRKPGKKDDDDGDAAAADDDDDAKDVPASAATEPPVEDQEEASGLSLGYWVGNTYINEYVGFGCDLDDAWQLYGAQEKQDLLDKVTSAGGEAMQEFWEANPQISAMVAENQTELVTMNLIYQKLAPEQVALYAALSEEETVDLTLEQMPMMEEYFNSVGITVYSHEKVKVTFLGEAHYAIYSVMELQGVPYYTLQLVFFQLGECGATLTLASYLEDNTQSLLGLFEPLS